MAWGVAVFCWSQWLLPHNVLPNAQHACSAGKRTRPGVHRPNGPQFDMAIRVTSENTYAQNARARIRARACNTIAGYRGCLSHKPITTRYLVLPDAKPRTLARRWNFVRLFWTWIISRSWVQNEPVEDCAHAWFADPLGCVTEHLFGSLQHESLQKINNSVTLSHAFAENGRVFSLWLWW